jgi:hypothetical protein
MYLGEVEFRILLRNSCLFLLAIIVVQVLYSYLLVVPLLQVILLVLLVASITAQASGCQPLSIVHSHRFLREPWEATKTCRLSRLGKCMMTTGRCHL